MRYKSGDCIYRVPQGNQVGTIAHNGSLQPSAELTAVRNSQLQSASAHRRSPQLRVTSVGKPDSELWINTEYSNPLFVNEHKLF